MTTLSGCLLRHDIIEPIFPSLHPRANKLGLMAPCESKHKRNRSLLVPMLKLHRTEIVSLSELQHPHFRVSPHIYIFHINPWRNYWGNVVMVADPSASPRLIHLCNQYYCSVSLSNDVDHTSMPHQHLSHYKPSWVASAEFSHSIKVAQQLITDPSSDLSTASSSIFLIKDNLALRSQPTEPEA